MAQERPEQFQRHLARGLAPVYLIAGEEPLLVEETLTALRGAAREAGFDEREVLHADGAFDWSRLREARDNLSLFAERRLIEVRLPGGKPGNDGARMLKAYAGAPPSDTLLVVITERLDAAQRRSAWASALERAGVMVYAWPVRAQEMPGWLRGRLRAAGLEADDDALAVLVERAEGNLLAAAQEVEKLRLIHGGGRLDAGAVRAAVASSARFDAFDLTAAARGGDPARVLRVARGLREEGEEPPPVLGALAREIRVLAGLQAAQARGDGADAVFQRQRVPRPQQGALWRVAVATPPGAWEALLGDAAAVDAVIKGAAPGRAWDELVQLAVSMATLARQRSAAAAGSGR